MGKGSTFNFIWAGRGTGKTYGALKYLIENKYKFIMIRRTNTAVERLQNPDMNPFAPLNDDGVTESPLKIESAGNNINNIVDEDGNFYGMLMSLTAVASIRGFSATWCTHIFYDEFIKEKQEKKIKGEAEAFMNAYETINRNRELKGEPPVRCILCSNAELLQNPIFMGFNLISYAERLHKSEHQEVMTIRERSITLVDCKFSPVSERKKDTALYRATQGTRFAKMALDNEFELTPATNRRSENLKEYRIIAVLGKLAIYRHKSEVRFYVTETVIGSAPAFGADPISVKRFRQNYTWFWGAYVAGRVIFENLYCESLLTNYYGIDIM